MILAVIIGRKNDEANLCDIKAIKLIFYVEKLIFLYKPMLHIRNAYFLPWHRLEQLGIYMFGHLIIMGFQKNLKRYI